MNKNKPLENLNDINDVYDNPVDMIEEIIYFNKFKGNKNLIKDETELNSSELDFAENDQIEDDDEEIIITGRRRGGAVIEEVNQDS